MWKEISDDSILPEIAELSHTQPVLIFKHSTRCGISSMAKNRIERNWSSDQAKKIQPYLLDLIRYRSLSQAIAEKFRIIHESPQVLLIANGECIYDASHMEIDFNDIVRRAAG